MTKIITNKDNYNSKKYNSVWPPKENQLKKIVRSIEKIFSGKNVKVLLHWNSPKIMSKYYDKQSGKINESFMVRKYYIKGKSIELFISKDKITN
jgi:hypothetical protein